ncbi:hypothetical protein VTI74DRAFT_5364 [Chaetomium olivicolor]
MFVSISRGTLAFLRGSRPWWVPFAGSRGSGQPKVDQAHFLSLRGQGVAGHGLRGCDPGKTQFAAFRSGPLLFWETDVIILIVRLPLLHLDGDQLLHFSPRCGIKRVNSIPIRLVIMQSCPVDVIRIQARPHNVLKSKVTSLPRLPHAARQTLVVRYNGLSSQARLRLNPLKRTQKLFHSGQIPSEKTRPCCSYRATCRGCATTATREGRSWNWAGLLFVNSKSRPAVMRSVSGLMCMFAGYMSS